MSASNTIGVMSDRRKSSRAAVNPAGPAPAMMAIFPGLSVVVMPIEYSGCTALDEKKLAAREIIPKKSEAGRAAFGDKVVQSQIFDPYSHCGGVDGHPDGSDGGKAYKLEAWVLEAAILE